MEIKHLLLFLIPFSLFPPALQAQEGWWQGFIEEAKLPICLHLQQDTLLMYSPLQTRKPIPPTTWSFAHDTLRYHSKPLGVRLTLVYHAEDSTLHGTFRQGLLRSSLVFHPCQGLPTYPRPQTPQEPYAFEARELSIETGKDVVLSGTLALPRTPEPKGGYPCVVLISGSGQQNRDEELYLHRPFLVWAEYLAQQGIATFRYDDRGVGGSRGDVKGLTTQVNADDCEAVFRAIRKQKHVNPKQIGLMGHSEGGAIAPMVAARNRRVAFVVMLAGQGCTGHEVLRQQNEAIYRLSGATDSAIHARLQWLDRQLASPTLDPWTRAFVALDPATYLPQVQCPLLAVNGDRDCQVLAQPNQEAIRRLTQGNPHAEYYQPEAMNHLLQRCQRGDVAEYVALEQTVAPEVLERVGQFIKTISTR